MLNLGVVGPEDYDKQSDEAQNVNRAALLTSAPIDDCDDKPGMEIWLEPLVCCDDDDVVSCWLYALRGDGSR
jgi:hypothetical protein